MKCSTINLVQLFILLFTVIGSSFANASKPISQLEKNEFKDLAPEFKDRLIRWMAIKQRECKLKQSDDVQALYLDCSLCKVSVESVQFFTKIHMDNTVISIIKNFCTYIHIESADVCKGIIEAFKVSSSLLKKVVVVFFCNFISLISYC